MRPIGEVRQALLCALEAGASGELEALAALVRVPTDRARYALRRLAREGVVKGCRHPSQVNARGRPRLVYAKPAATPALELALVMGACWR